MCSKTYKIAGKVTYKQEPMYRLANSYINLTHIHKLAHSRTYAQKYTQISQKHISNIMHIRALTHHSCTGTAVRVFEFTFIKPLDTKFNYVESCVLYSSARILIYTRSCKQKHIESNNVCSRINQNYSDVQADTPHVQF